MSAAATPITDPVELGKAKALLESFFYDPKAGLETTVVQNDTFLAILLRTPPSFEATQFADDALDTAFAAFKEKFIPARAAYEEGSSRYKYLLDSGAIARSGRGSDMSVYTGCSPERTHILDMGKLASAIAAYPYPNPKFPKPNVVETNSIEHQQHLVEGTSQKVK